MKFGDKVKWSSQANGSRKEKTGIVVEVVPAGRYPSGVGHADGRPRDHESYLVKVPTKSGKGMGKFYWPRVKDLKLVEEAEG